MKIFINRKLKMENIIESYENYDNHVKEALDDVNSGQHLRFINSLYRTKEVCFEAVKYESTHTLELNDFHSVPTGNLDYVTNCIREIMKDNREYLTVLDKMYLERKKQEKQSESYGDFKTLKDNLDYYKVDNYDDMLCKIYDIKILKILRK